MLSRSLATLSVSATGLLIPLTALAQPTLVWETTVSVTSETNEGGDDLVVDAAGNVFVLGYLNVEQDFYVLKFDPDGELLWQRIIGGSGLDNASDLAVDEAGDIYIAGRSLSDDFPVRNAYQPTRSGPSDAILMKLDGEDGSTVFATYFGGTHSEWAYGIGLGPDGRITIAGSTDSINLETVNPIQDQLTLIECFCDDLFVTQFTANADEILFSTYLGGTFDDIANDVAVDQAGDIYIAGRTASEDFPTANAVQATAGGGDFDAFVARIAADYTLSYSTYLGGEDRELVSGVDSDGDGAAYVTGSTRSISFPTTPGAFQEQFVGGILACEVPFGADQNCYDMFVTKLNADGSYGYSTFIGGHQEDGARNIDVDAAGRAHVIGYTYSDDFPSNAPFGNVVAFQLNGDGSDLNYLIAHDSPGANQGAAIEAVGNDLFIATNVGLPYDTYAARFSGEDQGPIGDVNGDGIVDISDFLLLLAAWGPCDAPCPPACAADFDGDCTVGVVDLLTLLANWS